MKYKIGDRVEYFNNYNTPCIRIGIITETPTSSDLKYIIDGDFVAEYMEMDFNRYIIKKIMSRLEETVKELNNTQKSTMNYYVGDIVKHQFKDGGGHILFDIGVIKKIILLNDDNIDIYRIQSCTKDDVFRDVIKDYIIQTVHVEDKDKAIKEFQGRINKVIQEKVDEFNEGKKENKKEHTAGRPLKFRTVEELQEKIEEYKRWAIENCKPLTIERLACFLESDRDTILNYGKLEGREQFFGTIEKIKNYILADKMERLNSLEGSKTGIIFDLKNNYNMRDRTETEHSTPDGKPFQIERKNLSEKEIDARILELTQKFNPS